MRRNRRLNLVAAVLVLLAVLVLNGVVSLISLSRLSLEDDELVHGYKVLSSLQSTFIAVDDAETGQRGFIITGKPAYLVPYRDAEVRARANLLRVRELTAGDAAQQTRVTRLEGLVNAKFAELQKTVNLRQRGQTAQARAIVVSGRGGEIMRSIRALVADMEARENATIRQGSAEAADARNRAVESVIAATVANVGLLLVIALLVRRAWQRREQRGRERAELLAREQEARARAERVAAEQAATLGQMNEGLVIAAPGGEITFMNDAARRLYGIEGDRELNVRTFMDEVGVTISLLDGGPIPPMELTLLRALEEGGSVIGPEMRVTRADGSEVVIQASSARVTAPDGTVLGSVALVRDVTAERILNQQRDTFVSAAAHDLKNPLATIKGLAQMLARRIDRAAPERPLDVEAVRRELRQIDVTANRMTALINELTDVTRAKSGDVLGLEMGRTDLVALVRRVVEAEGPVTRRHTIRLESCAPRLEGTWDEARLERVIGNIVSNAVKYSPDGGEIDVWIDLENTEDGRWAVVRVRDRGIGIPEADRERVFERFYRAGNVPDGVQGTGIGLAGAKYIVEQHGGTIGVESGEGMGTTFTVLLPLH